VAAGEIFMLVGPSGCGKTTLISVMAGILNQDEGSCTLFGQDMSLLSGKERNLFRGRHIGFVFQAFNLVPTLTAAENACLPLLINGAPRKMALNAAMTMLQEVGLSGKEASLPHNLSGGQQQRVAIARALVHKPKLVVCDEPTSALDHRTGGDVMNLLQSIAVKEDRSLVIVTHDPRIFDYADRIAHMDDGRIDRVEHVSAKHHGGCT
jgi:putative ABC transport system ATP-binding protein